MIEALLYKTGVRGFDPDDLLEFFIHKFLDSTEPLAKMFPKRKTASAYG
jgi:hypothetical protein